MCDRTRVVASQVEIEGTYVRYWSQVARLRLRSQVGPHPTVGWQQCTHRRNEGMSLADPNLGWHRHSVLDPSYLPPPFPFTLARRAFEPKTPKREGCVRAKYATARDAPSTEGPTLKEWAGAADPTPELSVRALARRCRCLFGRPDSRGRSRHTRAVKAIRSVDCESEGGAGSAPSRGACRRRAPNTRDK